MNLNVAAIQEVLDLHRSGFDKLVPMHESLKQHYEQNRLEVLKNHQALIEGLELFIYAAAPENPAEQGVLAEVERIVDEFAAWVQERLNGFDSNAH
jgi:hypothetical protein